MTRSKNNIHYAKYFFGLALFAVLFLNISYFNREILPFQPMEIDEFFYLVVSYRFHDHYEAQGLASALERYIANRSMPQGRLYQAMVGMVHVLSSPSRASAYAVNLILFSVLSLFMYFGIKSWTRSRSLALTGVFTLLTANILYSITGGMVNFRLDFAALCLFGIWISGIVYSNFFQRRWATVFVAALAAIAVYTRYNLAVYMYLLPLAAWSLVTLHGLITRQVKAQHSFQLNTFIYVFLLSIFLIPYVLQDIGSVAEYYNIKSFLKRDGSLDTWARDTDWAYSLRFYIKPLFGNLLGVFFFVTLLAISCYWVFWQLRLRASLKSNEGERSESGNDKDNRYLKYFIYISILLPIAILVWYPRKNAVAIGVVLVPIIYASILFVNYLISKVKTDRSAISLHIAILAAVIAVVSNLVHFSRTPFTPNAENYLLWKNTIDELNELNLNKKDNHMSIFQVSNSTQINHMSFPQRLYEKYQLMIRPERLFVEQEDVNTSLFRGVLSDADVLIYNPRGGNRMQQFRYSNEKSTEIKRWINKYASLYKTVPYRKRNFEIYLPLVHVIPSYDSPSGPGFFNHRGVDKVLIDVDGMKAKSWCGLKVSKTGSFTLRSIMHDVTGGDLSIKKIDDSSFYVFLKEKPAVSQQYYEGEVRMLRVGDKRGNKRNIPNRDSYEIDFLINCEGL